MLERYLTRPGRHLLNRWLHLAVLISVIIFVVSSDEQPDLSDQTINNLYNWLTFPDSTVVKVNDLQYDQSELNAFYARRNYRPVWLDSDRGNTNGKFLLQTLSVADTEGLNPDDYQVNTIQSLLGAQKVDHTDIAKAELMLTIAYAQYATHLRNSPYYQNLPDGQWPARPAHIDMLKLLESGLEAGNIFQPLFDQTPPHWQYRMLRKHLAELREMQAGGGWLRLPDNSMLKPGTRDNRVIALRKRLVDAGDLSRSQIHNRLYNDELVDAVSAFQRRHGILVDGVAGQETLDVLNVSVDQRIKQTIINMHRWRLVPRDFGRRYVMVNAAGFDLVAVQNDSPELEMRVIVGDDKLPTPVFSSNITHMVLNPTWNVPRSIAVNELLKKAKLDDSFLTEKNFKLISGWNENETEVDISTFDWQPLSDRNFPYRFRQLPGPKNPLGKIKFSMANPYDVYLHDTPHKSLFNHVYRDMSHGCIRLEEPLKLARFLMRGDSAWTATKIRESLDSNETLQINVAEPLPVHVLYFTVWISQDGHVSYYKDIYQNDKFDSSGAQFLLVKPENQ